MNFQILANKCADEEVDDLDCRLPSFYEKVSGSFLDKPKEVEIVIVKDKKEMIKKTGNECVACTIENKIFVLQPHRFEHNNHNRDEFYHILYRELMNLLYNYRN
ncbi:hypothetical protein CL616_05080 [archaeon]|nr:hypothetical protein [archaeon]|tara:strand:+ start:298 stop:609 length:312 start_codon:yes stop_codon:yes gene_type:complete